MAKAKKTKTVVDNIVKVEEIKIPEPETTIIDSSIVIKPIIDEDPNEVEVIGLAAAERLQKSGWQLIDCHSTPDGKVYKFKKGN